MSRVTTKLQVTIPKAIAERYRIEPGEEIDWLPAGEAIRVVTHAARQHAPDRARRLELFDRATDRQRARESEARHQATGGGDRGWTREELYRRGGAG
jgi:AbrB family looped-hinge helix DNA binding protein